MSQGQPPPRRGGPLRLDADAEDVGRGLGRLVLALLEIVRQLLERQAVRRVDAGDLTPEEVERLGQALLALQDKFTELREVFGVDPEDLRLPVDLEGLLPSDGAGPGGRTTHPPTEGTSP
jgi:hypothetical protein